MVLFRYPASIYLGEATGTSTLSLIPHNTKHPSPSHGTGRAGQNPSSLYTAAASAQVSLFCGGNKSLLWDSFVCCASHAHLYALLKAAVQLEWPRVHHFSLTGLCPHHVQQTVPQQQPTKRVYFKYVWLHCRCWIEKISVQKTEAAQSKPAPERCQDNMPHLQGPSLGLKWKFS